VIYLDTSVVLAQILSVDHTPPDALWNETLVSSRLLEYETWNRLTARGLATSHGPTARAVLSELAFLELSPLVLRRALEPFPMTIRTFDALHLASAEYLHRQSQRVQLATYDARLLDCAERLGLDTWPL
jgi:predicted nucleic acid-binding protein